MRDEILAAQSGHPADSTMPPLPASSPTNGEAINTTPVIWTPAFIIGFTLVLVSGLSAASIITRGVVNGYYPASIVITGYTIVSVLCWLVLAFFARTGWTRLAALSGSGWVVLQCIQYYLLTGAGNTLAAQGYPGLIRGCCILICFISLLRAQDTPTRWQRLIPWLYTALLSIGLIIAQLLANPQVLVLSILILSLLFCWIYPTRGHKPIALALLLTLALLAWDGGALVQRSREAQVFFAQVSYLAILLAVLYTIQRVRRFAVTQETL